MKRPDLTVGPSGVLRSYSFFVGALMFGLPLLISYYTVAEGLAYARLYVAVYVVVVLALGVALLLKRGKPDPGTDAAAVGPEPVVRSSWQLGPFLALGLASLAVAAFGVMRYLVATSYPYPSSSADLAGGIYVLALGGAAAVGVPYLVTAVFPFVKVALADRRLRLVAYVLGVVYFVTYEVLVNEIVITGYNTGPGNFVTSPSGLFPWAYVFTSGPAPANAMETAIYSPYVLVQLNAYVNFIFQPFELFLAVVMSTLVAAAVVATYNLVRRNERMGGACSTSATLSGVGAFLGYTATCPSCLAPTLVSVVFGGLASVQAAYSNLWGAVVPPIVSVMALAFSLYVVGRGYSQAAKALRPPGFSSPG